MIKEQADKLQALFVESDRNLAEMNEIEQRMLKDRYRLESLKLRQSNITDCMVMYRSH